MPMSSASVNEARRDSRYSRAITVFATVSASPGGPIARNSPEIDN
jgi:hypothetical protein